ncbi:hypothetical protein JS520_00080 [Candidatus Vidania fulgoroideae]|nr:hypothetical protein JS520_00080 [Candidatus Vidania fulgoroideae]
MFLNSDIVFWLSKFPVIGATVDIYLYKGMVVEVGSGIGNLIYQFLVWFCTRLFLLIEVNSVFCEVLVFLLAYNNVIVYNVNFLVFAFFAYIYVTFISNAPFSISLALLYKLLCYRFVIICQYLMLQFELYLAIFVAVAIKFFCYLLYYFCRMLMFFKGDVFDPPVAVSTIFFVMYPKYIPYETKSIYFFIISYFAILKSLLALVSSFFQGFITIYNSNKRLWEFYFCIVFVFIKVTSIKKIKYFKYCISSFM